MFNARGSTTESKDEEWSFTVDAVIFTFGKIDSERYDGMVSVVEALSKWIRSDLGLYSPKPPLTLGTKLDQSVSFADSRGYGFYIVKLDVEDVTMARGNYRFRRNIKSVNAKMLDASEVSGAYTYRSGTVKPRMAPELRLLHGPSLREIIGSRFKREP